MSTTMKVAVHLGPNYNENLEVFWNANFKELNNLFDLMHRLKLDHQAEILNVSASDWTAPLWETSTLSHQQVIRWTKEMHVCSDSVFFLEKMQEP